MGESPKSQKNSVFWLTGYENSTMKMRHTTWWNSKKWERPDGGQRSGNMYSSSSDLMQHLFTFVLQILWGSYFKK